MSNQTILIFIAAAAVVLLALFWRSKREERRVRAAQEKFQTNVEDPLTRSTRHEPEMSSMPDDDDEDEAPARTPVEPVLPQEPTVGGLKPAAKSAAMPSDEPPIYDELEAEAEEQEREEERAADAASVQPEFQSYPPVDAEVEWVLDITPGEGEQFALGGVKSLENEVKRSHFSMPVRIWARGIRDGLYCEARQLASPANHVVATMVLANRSGGLSDVCASEFFQVLEHAAAGVDATVRHTMDPLQAAKMADALKGFIAYYDHSIDIVITPADPSTPTFSLDAVTEAAQAAGFTAATGRWEYRAVPTDRDPVMTLAFGPEGSGSLVLKLDLPLTVLSRGDLQRFLASANHIAVTLHAQWNYAAAVPPGAAGAVQIERQAKEHAETMRTHGAEPGSARAKILFSRGG